MTSVDGLRGGALASGIHSHLLHGDPSVAQFVGSVMKRVASPIFRMIKRWVFEGELEDTHVRAAATLQTHRLKLCQLSCEMSGR